MWGSWTQKKGTIFSVWNLVSKLWVVLRNENLIVRKYFIFQTYGWKNVLYEHFINIAKVFWVNSKPFWRYQSFRPGRRIHVYTPPPIYGKSVKWRKTINEMCGNISGGNFLGGNFPGRDFSWRSLIVGNFPSRNFHGEIFLEPLLTYASRSNDLW